MNAAVVDSPGDPLGQRIESLFGSFVGNRPGAVVGIAHRGKTVYRGAFGLANVEHSVPFERTTRVPIASVTKQFACAVALQLQADGRLSLEDPIGRWLPELQGVQGVPTLRQLMTHTGGLRCFLELAVFNGVRTVPADFALATQVRQRGVNFQPGEGFLYSNGGYYLLSLALERATGFTFGELVREHCLLPAGLVATSAPRCPWPAEPGVATQYAPWGGGWRQVPPLLEEHLGDGSMVSTVDDMLAWLAYLRGGEGRVSLASLTAPVRLSNGDVSAYGFGLITEPWRGVRLVHHGGLLLGASCALLTVPEDDLDVFVASNSPAPVRATTLAIVEMMLGERLQPMPAAPRATDHPELPGRYLSVDGGTLADFVALEGGLGFSVFGMPAQPLTADLRDDGCWPFSAQGYSGVIRFAPAPVPGVFASVEPGLRREYRRLPDPVTQAREILVGADGVFESDEAGACLSFVDHAGELRVSTRGEYGRCEFVACILGDDLLRLAPVDYDVGWLARLERRNGRVEAVTLSSARVRGLRFLRRASGGDTAVRRP